jgi:hypothetical protein
MNISPVSADKHHLIATFWGRWASCSSTLASVAYPPGIVIAVIAVIAAVKVYAAREWL